MAKQSCWWESSFNRVIQRQILDQTSESLCSNVPGQGGLTQGHHTGLKGQVLRERWGMQGNAGARPDFG